MTAPIESQAQRAETLRRLHNDPSLLNLVNVWDTASACAIAEIPGTTAIATASAAVAASYGYEDGEDIPLPIHLAVLQRICSAVSLPVTADLERGYGDVRATIEAAIEAGVVGANIEDDMCPSEQMQQHIREAVQVGCARQVPLVLNARTDVYLSPTHWDEGTKLAHAVERGKAYLAAGADCIFVPGCVDTQSIRALVAAFGPGRLSLLAVPGSPEPRTLQSLGVARLSHGPFPHRRAMQALAMYQPSW